MTPAPTCASDESTTGLYGTDCSMYEHSPSICGYYDDEDFTASLQCCACGGYLGKTAAPTVTPAPSTSAPSAIPTTLAPSTPAPSPAPTATPAPTTTPCVNDDSTTGAYGTDCSTYEFSPSACGYYDDEDFTASLQCCACGGYLGKTAAPTVTPAPTCANDDSTTDSVGATCSSLYDYDPSYCGDHDDEDFMASLQCCACGGFLGKTFAPTITLVPSMSQAPSVTPVPSPAPTATPAPTAYCLCKRTLVVAVLTDSTPDETTWTLTMGDAPDECVDGSASGGPYSDANTLYTQEITICEDVIYDFEISDEDGVCCNPAYPQFDGKYYLELDGVRFHEGGEFEDYDEVEFTSLVTTFVLRGSLTLDGIAYETALANKGVFVAAIALMCGVAEESVVSVTISARRRRLDDSDPSHKPRLATRGRRLLASEVTVDYDVAVEDGDVMTIANRVEGKSAAQIDTAFSDAAADAGVADEFETIATTQLGVFTFTDPNGPSGNLADFQYTIGPTMSLAPSRSPAPSLAPSTAAPTLRPSMSAAPSITPAPTVTLLPTRTPYEYEEEDYTSYCQLRDSSVCWGNSHEFLKVKSGGPFDGIDWDDAFLDSNPAFGDLDGDNDFDLIVGMYNGKLYQFENTGSAMEPEFVPVGRTSPFHQIDVGLKAAPVLADLDRDGEKRCPWFDEPGLHISLAGDLDLIVGQNIGKLFYFENKGSARRPEFDQTGDTSLFSGGIATGAADLDYMPALADLDGDGP